MDHYLLNARSITHAQMLSQILERSGISVRIRRISNGLSHGGCGYTLQIPERQYRRAEEILKASTVRPVKVFHVSAGTTREVSL